MRILNKVCWANHLLPAAIIVVLLVVISACQPIQPVDSLEKPPPENTATTIEIADAHSIETTIPLTDTIEELVNQAPTSDASLIDAGMEVYHAQYCGICHVLQAAGTTGTFGPPHDGIAAVAAERINDARYIGGATTAAEYLYESLVEPKAFVVEGYVGSSHSMPPYTHLSEDELQALVALLLAQE